MNDRRSTFNPRIPEGWSTFALVAVILLSVIESVVHARWIDRLPPLVALSTAALFLGLVFSRFRVVPPAILHTTAFLVGSTATLWSVIVTLLTGPLSNRLVDLVLRMDYWGYALRTGGINTDPLPFAVLLAGLSWLLAYAGAWSCFRDHRPWWAIIPGGAVLLTSLAYGPSQLIGWFVLYLFASLFLIMRLNLYTQQIRWQRELLDYPRRIVWIWGRDTLAFALLIAALAWSVPPASASPPVRELWTRATDPSQSFAMEFNRMFAGIQGRDQSVATFFGNTLPLRGAFTQSEAPVMIVRASEPRYWRGTVYDTYTSQGWIRRQSERVAVPMGTALTDLKLDAGAIGARQVVTQSVVWATNKGGMLFIAGQPVTVSVPAEAEAARVPSGQADLFQLRSTISLGPGNGYSAVSSVSAASVEELRRSDQRRYPNWVREIYLPLPTTLPDRVHQLAETIAEHAPTNYDRAVAIESYLRAMKYTISVPPPPADRDAVDYFLFDVREGYCDYFASAMAVMLRSLGVPTRVVSGYQPGDELPGTDELLVRESNAHSWVEAYFPGQGWVEFEPTPSQPLRSRARMAGREPAPALPTPVAANELATPTATPEPEPRLSPLGQPSGTTVEPSDGQRTLSIPVWLVATLGVLVLIGVLAGLWRFAQRGLDPASAAYWRMSTLARWVGLRPRFSETPQEYGAEVDARIGGSEGDTIAGAYARQRYGPPSTLQPLEPMLQRSWLSIRGQLLLYPIRRWLGKVRRR